MFENGLFIFRRDLRIQDNIGLNLAVKECKNVHTIFIFTPEQVTNKNDFKSENAIQFMIESLDDLASNINSHGGKLLLFYGENESVISKYIKAHNIDALFFNSYITPYAIKRDKDIIKMCEKMKIPVPVFTSQDYYLYEPGSITTGGQVYSKFTPYYVKAIHVKVEHPVILRSFNFIKVDDGTIDIRTAYFKFTTPNENILVNGGREDGIKILDSLGSPSFKKYNSTRNDLNFNTTHLSAYIKFGCVSVREVFYSMKAKLGIKSGLIRQLIWREFYANILFGFPHVLKGALREKYNKIQWHHNQGWLNAWKDGRTGFPIIDAAMTELNVTGYMHNRGRLIVSSFLVKTLLINWQYGEKYFAQKLNDYDPASNNGNWQWIMGGGADSQPYYRIFNPWTQSKEHDPDCQYIKKWLPQLESVDSDHLHQWNEFYNEYPKLDYPKPIVDYSEQREKALKMYNDALH